jgi:MazG family protein
MSELRSKLNQPDLPPWERLKTIMAVLRSVGGCSWDRQQTHESLLPYLIEESYEVVEAIKDGDPQALKEELGDLLCQIIFHAQLGDEKGRFNADDIANVISDKLVRRHPHVFGEKKDLNPSEVRDMWERRKVESGEKKQLLSGLPASMPALTMAFRIGEKAAGVGFDWNETHEVVAKLEEEIEEIKAAVAAGDQDQIREEIGDLLFATASLARKLNIEPETALKTALEKFRTRFTRVEAEVSKRGQKVHHLTLDQLEEIWQAIKTDR